MIKPMKNSALDNTEFLSILDKLGSESSTKGIDIPTPIDGNFIAFGLWKFAISKVIFPTSTMKEILNGWNILIQNEIDVDILFLVLFFRTMLDASDSRTIEEEPELCALLRLCYWLSRCQRIEEEAVFDNKFNEMKTRLGPGVRTQIKEFQIPFKKEFAAEHDDYYNKLRPILQAIKQRKAPTKFLSALEHIRNAIYGYVSECMFYSIAAEAGFNLHFAKDTTNKNPDVLLNNIPTEIETIMDILKYQTVIEDSVIEELILSLIRDKFIQRINGALDQCAKIVVLDATGTSLGFAITLWTASHNKTFSTQVEINNAIMLVNNDDHSHVPVICFAQAYDRLENYVFCILTVPCPVKPKDLKVEVDTSRILRTYPKSS
ncbi:MAG TPA: hypothetical protein VH500_18440 [Nitrososphaeraceae archaeon]|jgi:hypothetical protein